MGRTLHYSIMDVFAEHALEGNPLAVFHDARSLSDDEMQLLARELNLAETTFILPEDDPENDRINGVRVRIFTTQEELPFAGHPTLGTSSWLYFNHPALTSAESLTLRLNVGPIHVAFEQRDEHKPGVRATMRQNDPVFGATHDPAEVARTIGLQQDDLLPGYAPQTVSTGMPFCIVPLHSLEVARRLQMVQSTAQAWLSASDAKFFYCIAPTNNNENAQWHARMQFYGGEDPATGSAAGCCIAWLVRSGLVPSSTPVMIEQGIEIQRPSRITAQANLVDGIVSDVLVGGRTIPVARGSFFLP
ncbi:MAG: PhzF family phenazine biosynthesis protein [Acidobacteriota bacterium]